MLSLLLVMITLVSIALPMTAEAAATTSTYPIVYVRGRRTPIYNKNGKQIYPLKTTIQDKLMQDKNTLMSAFSKSLLTNNWDPFCDALYKSIAPLYAELVLNNNGEISNGSYHKKSATPKKKTSGYVVSDYVFEYDSRVDPIASAKELQTYIKAVLKATGKKKVSLVGRCLGTSIMASYFTLYGATYVDTAVFYAAACNGILPIGATFSGHIQLDADNIDKYANSSSGAGDDFDEFVKALVTLTNQAKLLGVGTDKINSVYLSIADQILPKLLLATYGTMPCYWSMVSDEYFEAAKSFIFKGDTKKYAGLIKKINNYHYNVQVPLSNTLKKLKKNGLKIINISKYNVRLDPVFENCNIQADGTVELSTMSFGATSANIGKTLSKTYLKNVAASGMSSYVSKDNMIDASTCLFPDNTWFIKNLAHTNFPSCVNTLIYEALSSKGQFTIKSNKSFPQFLEYKNKKLVAVTQANPDDVDKEETSIISSFLKVLITAFTSTFGNLIKIVSGILSSQ